MKDIVHVVFISHHGKCTGVAACFMDGHEAENFVNSKNLEDPLIKYEIVSVLKENLHEFV
jgi:hypothetical protein